MIFSIGSSGGDQHLNALNNHSSGNGRCVGMYNTNATVYDVYQGVNLEASKWVHLVATRSGNVLRWYVDNIEIGVDSSANVTSLSYGSGTVLAVIGARFDKSLPFKGKIDHLRIYSQALSVSEVSELFKEHTLWTPAIGRFETSVYPQPASNKVNIDFKENESAVGKPVAVRVLDINCKELMGFAPSDNHLVLDISSLPEGVYIIQLLLSNGKFINQKIVKVQG